MAYHVKKSNRVPAEIRRILREQLSRARQKLINQPDGSAEAVHDARKHFKKIRALLRLVRPALNDQYKPLNVRFRDFGRELADFRDAQAQMETFEQLRLDHPDVLGPEHVDPQRVARTIRQAMIGQDQDRESAIRAVVASLEQSLIDLDRWTWPERCDSDTCLAGMKKTYRRGRKAMQKATKNPSPETLHEWRKRVKYHWYHTRLLRNIWPDILQPRAEALKQLSDALGENHDLDIFKDLVERHGQAMAQPTELAELTRIIDQTRARLRRRAHELGGHLYADKPGQIEARWARHWQTWQAHA